MTNKQVRLCDAELDLLKWLGESDYSQYGECYGKSLDSLISQGLAQIHNSPEHKSGFIAKGNGPMYRAVSLTDGGRKAMLNAQHLGLVGD
jgi:hypothetical protein